MQLFTPHRLMPSLLPNRSPWQALSLAYRCSMTSHAVEYFFGQFRSAVQAVPPPSFLCSSNHSLVLWCEKTKSPWLKIRTASQELIHHCVINLMLIINLKHIIVSATRKKNSSISAKTKTHGYLLQLFRSDYSSLCWLQNQEDNALLVE